MAIPSWTQTVDNMFTTTWSYRQGPAVEQAFLKNPFIFWLKENGRVKNVTGHTRIEIPLDYASNDTVGWVGKGDTVSINDTEFISMAYEDWKYLAVSIPRFGIEDQQNQGKARLINYVEAKLNSAERAMWESLEARICSTAAAGPKEMNAIGNLVENVAAASQGTVHNLLKTTYTWWANQYKAATGSYSIYLLSDMTNILNTVTKYSQTQVNDIFILTDQTSFEYYEEEVTEQKYIVNQKLGDAGFENVTFKGRPMVWSPSAEANLMYFLNTNYLSLVCDPTMQMRMTEWKAIPDQVDDKVAQIISAMNLVCTRCAAQGVLATSA